jgi:hypothetical protein
MGYNFVTQLFPAVQDLNVGIIALAVNFVVLVVVSFAVRAFASPHRVVHSR